MISEPGLHGDGSNRDGKCRSSHLQSEVYSTSTPDEQKSAHNDHEAALGPEPTRGLARKLSARQVQMIALAGTIGSGLFLGTGKSLASGGPASLLLAYMVVGGVIYLTMLSLGEMAAYMPISGSFGAYATRFVNEPLGFAIQWNYWANDAVSVAADLVAAQILIKYWNPTFPGWAVSLVFWVFVVVANIVSVRSYGEIEYWLGLLKIVVIVVFIILGACINAGLNETHTYIGGSNWHVGEAPFVGGFGGFASVFVTASFAYGGTESIGITAGETKNPAQTIPRTVRNVFLRILIFYILALLIIGLNIPYNTPSLSSGDAATSPFTLVFEMVGSHVAGSFINAVVLTSVLSAANHALYAGTRLMHSLASEGQAPALLFRVAQRTQVPWTALLATASISLLCFGASFIGAGTLWTWLQNLVGVSNQLAWLCIGIASIRFNGALRLQGKLNRLPFRNWTQPWGPWVAVVGSTFMLLVQGWGSFSPWSVSKFFSYYVGILIMLLFYVAWCLFNSTWFGLVSHGDMDLDTDAVVWESQVQEDTSTGVGAIGVEERKPLPRWKIWRNKVLWCVV